MASFNADEVVSVTASDVLELMGNDPQFEHLKRIDPQQTVAVLVWDEKILFPKTETSTLKRNATTAFGAPGPSARKCPHIDYIHVVSSDSDDSDIEEISVALKSTDTDGSASA